MDINDYDYIIVGSGLAGGVLARKLAENKNKILIVERRNHIAGNIYDYENNYGVKIQKYGPHVLHTNNYSVYSFITNFCEPISYKTKCEVVIDGISTPSPFNFKTIDQFYNYTFAVNLKSKLLSYYKNSKSVSIVEMLESNDLDIKKYAQFLYEKDYKLYTAKQWNLQPEDIDPSVLKRVPILLSYDNSYFYDKYEFLPKYGFTNMYSNIISHPNIEIKLGIDALEYITIDEISNKIKWGGKDVNIIYTGAIDELFKYKYGFLPYRSLYFEYKTIKAKSFQNVAIVAYPQEKNYTRITEYTKMPIQENLSYTTIAYEYPIVYDNNSVIGNEPYYPVLTDESKVRFEMYKKYSMRFNNLILCGRLADFRYYNMDQVILRALEIYKSIKKES